MAMRYEINFLADDSSTNCTAYSSEEAGEMIAELLAEYGEGSYSLEIQVYED